MGLFVLVVFALTAAWFVMRRQRPIAVVPPPRPTPAQAGRPAGARTPTRPLAAAPEPIDPGELIDQAYAAIAHGRQDQSVRLMARLFHEGLRSDVAVAARQLLAGWAEAVASSLPAPSAEDMRAHVAATTPAIATGDYPKAFETLSRVTGLMDPATLTAHPGAMLVLAGLKGALELQGGDAPPPVGAAGGGAPPLAGSPTADDWIERGHAMLDTDLERAMACYRRAREVAPEDGGGWAGEAMVLRQLGRHADALPLYDRLAQVRPDLDVGWYERADCLEVVGRLDESLASYDRALALTPTMAAAWVDRAHVLNRLKRHPEALESLERGLALAPDHARAWFSRAEQERVLGRPEAARRSYQRFLQLVPPGQEAELVRLAETRLAEAGQADPSWRRLLREADALVAEGDLAAAERRYREAAEGNPGLAPKIYFNLGMHWQQAEQFERALAAFEEAVTRDPGLLPGWQQLARLSRRMVRNEPALAAYQRWAALAPDPEVLGMVADLQFRLGRYQDVLATLATFEVEHPHLRRLRACCLMARGQWQEALDELEAIPPGDPNLPIDRGLCLERLGRKAEAIASFQRGHPMSGRTWCHLGRHQPGQAAEYFARAVEALAADERIDGLDPPTKAELAYARKQLAALDPARLAELEAMEQERRAQA